MGIATIKTDLAALKAAIESKKPSPILRAAAAVEVDAADILDLFLDPSGPPMFGADDKAECKSLCDGIEAACRKQIAAPAPMQAGPVGKLFPGDGSFLKILLELFLKLAPLFVEPAPQP